MTDIHCVLLQGDEQSTAALMVTPWGVPLLTPQITDELRLLVAATAKQFPEVRYTICKLVPVENATPIH